MGQGLSDWDWRLSLEVVGQQHEHAAEITNLFHLTFGAGCQVNGCTLRGKALCNGLQQAAA